MRIHPQPSPLLYPYNRYEPETVDYFQRLAAAGSSPGPNAAAMDDLIRGLKDAGLWSAIKACCLLAGPSNLSGALVPLVGPSPTNFNFTGAAYDRATGLSGNGSAYLDSGFDPVAEGSSVSDFHLSVATSGADVAGSRGLMAAEQSSGLNATALARYGSGTRNVGLIGIATAGEYSPAPSDTGFRDGVWLVSASGGREQTFYDDGTAVAAPLTASGAFAAKTLFVFATNGSAGAFLFSSRRIAYYSVGTGFDAAQAAAYSALISAYVAALV